jgi:hypothetical protein
LPGAIHETDRMTPSTTINRGQNSELTFYWELDGLISKGEYRIEAWEGERSLDTYSCV